MITIAAKLAASLVLAAGPAFSLTAMPAHLAASPGHAVRIEIIDTGSKPALIRTSLLNVRKSGHYCGVRAGAVPGVTIAPASIRLAPHGKAYATVTISRSAPASDLAVIFAADGAHGSVSVSGAVASQLVINGPHDAAKATACVSARLPRHTVAAAFPWPLAGGGGGALVALGLAVWLPLRRRRKDPAYSRRHGRIPVTAGHAYERAGRWWTIDR